ncbi:hypothetical protein N7539_003585 [Penicillium diatomitis]|uniref:TFIIIC transcription initiation factor complex subunits Tfc3 n=1 Tax=Penicillium diatomitis TaxID=2819901 RepID=A0A9X0BXF3_9EURO|nr:uncharacterized protein N7539_003585 [Penicillium diatomitis]KAJ5488695.1 hypothetical protein N7539_003585 [Penicillium diatomitis]
MQLAANSEVGATLREIFIAVEEFYKSTSRDLDARTQNVDRRFKAKVWSWLMRHTEVFVKPDGDWECITLDEAEQRDSELQQAEAGGVRAESDPDEIALSSPGVRIFVTKERMWYALTGHEPDDSKVPASEFLLLSIIAAHKSNGIAQTDLVRLSGQDKRSVPKRTDALAQKGYVEKRPIQIKAARTSLVTFRRFLKPATGESTTESSSAGPGARPLIDFDAFTEKLFGTLKEFGIISRDDLKKRLEFNDRWRWRILSRVLRKYERIGVLKRVRAKSQYDKYHPCVMLLREPTEADFAKFNAASGELSGSVDDQADVDDDIEDARDGAGADADDGTLEMGQDKPVIDSGRTVPCWTPDRLVGNQMFDVVHRAGTAGITNQEINRILFGSLYRRPSENVLHRLTDCWQLSQPPHLRHLGILRDTAIERTIFFYVHYSIQNFSKMVEKGDASWEAVEFPPSKLKAAKFNIPSVDAKAKRDQYGFHEPTVIRNLVKDGKASLFEAVAICKPPTYLLSSSDPMPHVAGTIIPSPISTRPHGGRPKGPRPKGDYKRSALSKMERSCPATSTARDTSDGTKLHDIPPAVPDHLTWEQPVRWTPRASNKRVKLEGLSEKERFEALGMDETWTEYNVLVNECPNPGVYVTPQGKRRPAGKRQGRPARSRIAVFRSDKIAQFPWFKDNTEDAGKKAEAGLENTPTKSKARRGAVPIAVGGGSDTTAPVNVKPAAQLQVTTRDFSRKRQTVALTEPSTSEVAATSEESLERPKKQPRIEGSDKEISGSLSVVSQDVPPETQSAPGSTTPADAAIQQPTKAAARILTPQRLRTASPAQPTPAKNMQTSPAAHPSSASRTRNPPPFSRDWLSKNLNPSATKPGHVTKLAQGLADRGGSVSLLRKKILMEIIEKAGGAYPSLPEIWFPFATAWLRRKQKERPDNRTVKTAIRNLVEAGKLRQLTFCGKGPKGAMVTRTILAKPEMSSDDPLIKDMQRRLLAATDQRLSYSPNVELDPELTKYGGQSGISKLCLPLVSGATVQLQEKPATVLAEEQRTERRVQKELLKKLEDQLGIPHDSSNHGTKRLMKIGRRQPRKSGSESQTLISRPGLVGDGKRARVDGARLYKHISAIGPHAMLMHPTQLFNEYSGTFGTFGTARAPRIMPKKLSSGELVNSVRELAELASSSNTIEGGQETSFHSQTDRILRWELDHEEVFDESYKETAGTYIGQTVSGEFEQVRISGDIQFVADKTALPRTRSSMVTRGMGLLRELRPGPQPFHVFNAGPARRRIDGIDTSIRNRDNVLPDDVRVQRPRRRGLLSLDQTLNRKIMVAIVAVRVLAGGSEAIRIDWDLVSAAFPKHDHVFIQDHARNILSKSRLQMAGMQRDFQERFLKAYAEGKVPPIDYNHLGRYNWPALVEWANIELEFSTSEKAPLLPATRQEFDSIFELRPEANPTADELYVATTGITLNFKRGVLAHVPFAVKVPASDVDHGRVGPRKAELARLDVVKSWVRANVAASESTYDPVKAEEALRPFGSSMINSAVQSLLTDRVISMGNKGRLVPGRNYDLTDHVLASLSRKRLIDCPILKRAAYFKTSILDTKLRQGGSHDVFYHAEDGDILAIINLFNEGHVTLRPRGQPRDKWGLTDGGYLTRQMDKNRLRFAVEVHPTDSYVWGNPIQDQVAKIPAPMPPASKDAKSPPKLPLWFDIHGFLIPQLWEMAIASVLGCVVMRQGLSAERISSMIKPAMGAWEIELLLNWLKDVGVMDRRSRNKKNGWMVRPWWWLVLTEGVEKDTRAGENLARQDNTTSSSTGTVSQAVGSLAVT